MISIPWQTHNSKQFFFFNAFFKKLYFTCSYTEKHERVKVGFLKYVEFSNRILLEIPDCFKI